MPSLLQQQSSKSDFYDDIFPLSLKIASSREEMQARFEEFARNNPDLVLEQTADGDIVVMLPNGGTSGIRGTELTKQVAVWAATAGGFVFDSQTLFKLPNGAKRGPDCSWVERERWEALSDDEQEAYPPLAPDLVIEVRSKSDRLNVLQAKMFEYISCGVRLGWLIDPYQRDVYVYQSAHEVVVVHDPQTLDGGEVARGLKLDLVPIFR